MKTYFSPVPSAPILTVFFFLFFFSYSIAGNYTWTGTISTSWTNPQNWSPNGNPSTNDSVIITAGSNNCLLTTTTTIKQFEIDDDTMDFNGYVLKVSNNATVKDGFLTNGTLDISGTGLAEFYDGIVAVTLIISSNRILFSGSTFNNAVTAVKKGSSTSTGNGGCEFNSTVTLIDSGSGAWTFANADPDEWHDKVTVSETSSGIIYFAHKGIGNSFDKSVTFKNNSTGEINCDFYGTSTFSDSIIVNATSSGSIYFGNSGGTTTLDTSIIVIGASGLSSSAKLILGGIFQNDDTKSIALTGTGTSAIVFASGSIFSGRVTARAPGLSLDGSYFTNVVSMTHLGSGTTNCQGGCYFQDSTLIVHDNPTGGAFNIAVYTKDVFDGPVTIENSNKGTIALLHTSFTNNTTFINHSKVAGTIGSPTTINAGFTFLVGDGGNCSFQDSLTLISDTSSFAFGTSNGAVTFSDASLLIDSDYIGNLLLTNVQYNSEQKINIPFENNYGILMLDTNNSFGAPVICNTQRIQLNGSTFNDTLLISTTTTDGDTCKGGNVFNGITVITDSNTTSTKSFLLAYTYPDDFNGNVTFKQYGIGRMYPSYLKNSTFAGDIIIDGTSDILFGNNGGKIIIDGANEHILSKLGSYKPVIKKLEMKKDDGSFRLTMPMTVSDSVIFTKGYMMTDSANLLKIPDNCIVTGASDSSFVIGSVKKTGNDAFTFPLGDKERYHPLSMTAPANATDAFTAKYVFDSHGLSTNADSTIENESLCEYWKVIRDTGTSKIKVRLGWNVNSCNVFGLDSMHVAVWDTTNHIWKDKGNGGTTGSLAVGSVISNDSLSLFGIITLADLFCTSLTLTPTANDVTCPGYANGSARIDAKWATPPYTYSWSPHTGGSVSIWDISAGTYYITVTDSRSCTIIDSVIVSDPDSIHLAISVTPSDCLDSVGTAKVTASGGDTSAYYFFWNPNGYVNDSIGGLAAGVYSVTVTDAKGCSVDTSVFINDSDGPDASVDVVTNVGCNGYNDGSIELGMPIGGLPTDPIPLCTNAAGNTNRLAAGFYPIIVTDTNGCVTVVTATISEPPPLTLIFTTTKSQCGDSTGSATVEVSGGTAPYSYSWSSGGTDSVDINIPSGLDTVIVTDANGCASMAFAAVVDTNGPVLSISSNNLSCFNDSSGQVSVIASSGASPFEYNWLEIWKTDSAVDSLSAGIFHVLVTDSNGCKSIDSVLIVEPNELNVQYFHSYATSYTDSDGYAYVEVQGGTLPYQYLWLPDSETTASVTGLGYDSLEIRITDGNGCSNLKTWPSRLSSTTLGCASPTGHSCQRDLMNNCFDPSNSAWDPCPTHDCLVMSIAPYMGYPDFGATPGDDQTDECAFEKADYYINNFVNRPGGLNDGETFTLLFPPGTYDIGRQTYWGESNYIWTSGITESNDCWYAKGHDIFLLNGINRSTVGQHNPIIFRGIPDQDGIVPKFRYLNCLSFGVFQPIHNPPEMEDGYRRLMGNTPLDPYDDKCGMAEIGNTFMIIASNDITIENLELDGNLPNLSIGGATGTDGIILAHYGILMNSDNIEGSHDININNVNAHDFGGCGIEIHPGNGTNVTPRANLVMRDSKFNKNGFCGFAWESCAGIRAYNCQFNRNAMDVITTIEASGIDIEGQGTPPPSDGIFDDCEFKYNLRCGVQSEGLAGEYGFSFTRCTFVGSEFTWDPVHVNTKIGNPVFMRTANTHFNCCDFHGCITTAYTNPNGSATDKTVFNLCTFNEEYTDPDNNKVWSFNDDCEYDYADCNNSSGLNGPKWFLVTMGNGVAYRKLTFNECSFKTNYSSSICILKGGATTNSVKLINCDFYNGGVDRVTPITGYCSTAQQASDLMYLESVNFVGRNTFTYRKNGDCYTYPGSVRNNTGIHDYTWGLFYWLRNGIPQPALSNQNGSIFLSYYAPINSTCIPNPASPLILPFERQDFHIIDQNYDHCSERFTNFSFTQNTTRILFSGQVDPDLEPIGFPCDGSGNRFASQEGVDKMNGVFISPNPSNEYISVNNILKGNKIEIYNCFGELLIKEIANSEALQFDISSFSPGIYFLRADGRHPTKFIKIN